MIKRYSNSQTWFGLASLITYVSLIILAVLGWVFNIIKLFYMDGSHVGMLWARILGVVVPIIGAILGWIS